MGPQSPGVVPSGHTPSGGVLVGSESARHRMVVYEDMQCPFCRRFEERSGDLLRREIAAGAVAVEYRIRSFLGPESVRAANALAAAAEEDRFDQLRRELFATQPDEHSGGYTAEELIASGRHAGIASENYVAAVREGRYEAWVNHNEGRFQEQDPDGTPAGNLDGVSIPSAALSDPSALANLIRR